MSKSGIAPPRVLVVTELRLGGRGESGLAFLGSLVSECCRTTFPGFFLLTVGGQRSFHGLIILQEECRGSIRGLGWQRRQKGGRGTGWVLTRRLQGKRPAVEAERHQQVGD